MIEAIKNLGKGMLKTSSEAAFISNFIDLDYVKKNNTKNIIIFDFKSTISDPEIKIEIWGIDEEKLDKIKWIGNIRGSGYQDRLTTSDLKYLVSQCIPFLEMNLSEDSELKKKLKLIVDKYYYKIKVSKKSNLKYSYIWDLSKMGINEKELLSKKERSEIDDIIEDFGFCTSQFYEKYIEIMKTRMATRSEEEKEKQSAQKLRDLVTKCVVNWLVKKGFISNASDALFTVKLDGELLAEHPDYHVYLERRLVDEVFEEDEFLGQCYTCGNNHKTLTKNFTKFGLLKFYINDKLSFASEISKEGFYKNYAVCEDCYKSLLVGEKVVKNFFKDRIGEAEVYLIPEFYQSELSLNDLYIKDLAKHFNRSLGRLNKYEAWQDFESKIFDEQKRRFNSSCLLNFLFVKAPRGSLEVKVLKFIQDVPPGRLDELADTINEVYDLFDIESLYMPNWLKLDYSQIYFLLPIRKVNNEPQIGIYLDIIDFLFKGTPIKLSVLIKYLMETARVHFYEKYESYVQNKYQKTTSFISDLDRFLIISQLFIYYLKKLNMLNELQGGELNSMWQNLIPKNIKLYWEKIGLEDTQRALFLLGYLIGEIGKKQYQEGDSKPIMNKLNYQGMTEEKLKVLSAEILDKLYQYRIWSYNEGIYAAMKELFDMSLGKFNSLEENVYWILSGYAFSTAQAIMNKDYTESEQENKNEEE